MENLPQKSAEGILKGKKLIMWINENGIKNFHGNIEDEELLENAAKECGMFAEDVEDELVSDKPVTCLNCRYRRWTPDGFSCQKKSKH